MAYILKSKRDGFNIYTIIKTYTDSSIIVDEFFNTRHITWAEHPMQHTRYHKNLR